jgi:hypothetical protein
MMLNVSLLRMQVWLDARSTGLDRDKWLQECMAEIEARPPRTRLQAHLAIKGFLARGPADPYTRFIPPEEFKQLTKFDVSGAGVNVVTAEEYQQKIVKALPRNKTSADGGVWVVGLMKVPCSAQPSFHSFIVVWETMLCAVCVTTSERGSDATRRAQQLCCVCVCACVFVHL